VARPIGVRCSATPAINLPMEVGAAAGGQPDPAVLADELVEHAGFVDAIRAHGRECVSLGSRDPAMQIPQFRLELQVALCSLTALTTAGQAVVEGAHPFPWHALCEHCGKTSPGTGGTGRGR
jgi:hypothetical protein